MDTTIILVDNGIGIFRKIKEFCKFDSLDDAVNELFKGKLTTDTANHSGEGIFFTSRILDEFAAVSDEKVFTHNKFKDNYNNLNGSRSQAKRLYHRFDKFQEIELDFKDISEIGQGFAHELFVVFQKQHPNIRLLPINASDDVNKMIKHVINTVN